MHQRQMDKQTLQYDEKLTQLMSELEMTKESADKQARELQEKTSQYTNEVTVRDRSIQLLRDQIQSLEEQNGILEKARDAA